MKQKRKQPWVPADRKETVRKQIISLLREQVMSAREISGEVHISEKDVINNLQFIQKTVSRDKEHFRIIPAECRKCRFVFKKRDRFNKPGKCPVCKSELIKEPLFSIRLS